MLQMINGQLVQMTAEEAAAFEATRQTVPQEVAMHRIKKAARLTPWSGSANLLEAINTAIAGLPAPKNDLAAIEFEYAPNLVRDGLTTLAVMEAIGMTEVQRDELLTFAASLP